MAEIRPNPSLGGINLPGGIINPMSGISAPTLTSGTNQPLTGPTSRSVFNPLSTATVVNVPTATPIFAQPPAPAPVVYAQAPPALAPPQPVVYTQAPAPVVYAQAPPAAVVYTQAPPPQPAPAIVVASASKPTATIVTPVINTEVVEQVRVVENPAVMTPRESKSCYRNNIKGSDDSTYSVDEILLSRQFNILNVYLTEGRIPKLIKVEDFLGNISFILFDRPGSICVKDEIVKIIRKVDTDATSAVMKNGTIQTALTEGVVIEKDKSVTIVLKGARPTTETESWIFADDTVANGIYPMVQLDTLFKVGVEMVGTINESVKYLDKVALMRAVGGATLFNRSLDSLSSYKQLREIIIKNGGLLINTDAITTQLAKLYNLKVEAFPDKISTIAMLLQKKRLHRQMFNQLLMLAEDIIRINADLCEIGSELLEIFRILSVQSERICKGV